MRIYWVCFLSILFLISSCNSYEALPVVKSAVTYSSLESTPTESIELTSELASEIVLLDFALSPDGKRLAIYLNTGVYLYDIETSDYITLSKFESDKYYSRLNAGGHYYPPLGAPGAVAFSPDGKEIATSGKFQDEYITIWDWENKTILKYIANYPNGDFVRELEYDPDGITILIRSTYPLSRLHCEVGSEDSLTLISLDSRSELFQKDGCNQYSSINFYFAGLNTLYLFHYGASVMYLVYEIDTEAGDILKFNELDSRSVGLIYAVSQSGKTFAARDPSNLSDGLFRTILTDATTKKELLSLSGNVTFLEGENRFLVLASDGQVRLQENNSILCQFDGLEYLHSIISRDKSTLAAFTRDQSVQIWDIPGCKMLNTVPIN